MSVSLNPKTLEAILDLCDTGTLECNIRLMEDSIDAIIDEDSIEPAVRLDLIAAYRRLGKQLQAILNAMHQTND